MPGDPVQHAVALQVIKSSVAAAARGYYGILGVEPGFCGYLGEIRMNRKPRFDPKYVPILEPDPLEVPLLAHADSRLTEKSTNRDRVS